jgi:hypothetical protein
MAQTTRTIDHDEVKDWIVSRGGSPAAIEGTFDGYGNGVLRVDFGATDEALDELSWEDFFRVFDDNDLAFVYESESGGIESYVCSFVARNEDAEFDEGEGDVSDGF